MGSSAVFLHTGGTLLDLVIFNTFFGWIKTMAILNKTGNYYLADAQGILGSVLRIRPVFHCQPVRSSFGS